MAVDFRTRTVTIPNGTGLRNISETVTFSSNVTRASVALNGFRFDFSNDDHHINLVQADTDIVSVSGRNVTFRVQCHYADKNFDDPYSGWITATIIAEV